MQIQDTRNQIARRIREHGAPPKVEELCLDEIKVGLFEDEVREIVDRCVKVECLSMSSCGLTSLFNFPNLQQLQVLELSHNLLEGERLEPLSRLLRLYSLNLDSNRIEDFNWTRFFKRIRLTTLSLVDNPLTQTCSDRDYRDKIYRALGADL
jgi:hypothetical protein